MNTIKRVVEHWGEVIVLVTMLISLYKTAYQFIEHLSELVNKVTSC